MDAEASCRARSSANRPATLGAGRLVAFSTKEKLYVSNDRYFMVPCTGGALSSRPRRLRWVERRTVERLDGRSTMPRGRVGAGHHRHRRDGREPGREGLSRSGSERAARRELATGNAHRGVRRVCDGLGSAGHVVRSTDSRRCAIRSVCRGRAADGCDTREQSLGVSPGGLAAAGLRTSSRHQGRVRRAVQRRGRGHRQRHGVDLSGSNFGELRRPVQRHVHGDDPAADYRVLGRLHGNVLGLV
jgi:hypothetical protein